MNFNFDFNFNFSFGEVVKPKTYLEICEAAGYPKPYPLQIKMKDFVINRENIRMLLGARRYGKTDYCTILGVAEKLYRNPQYKILIITKEMSRGKDIVGEVREVLEKIGCSFKNRAKTTIRLAGQIGKDPNLGCATVRSRSIRGRHPDLIIMEDPITPEDVSAAERKRVKKAYEELLKLTHNLCIIGQPVHKLDLYQELRDQIPTFLAKYGDIPELDADLDAERAAGVDEFSIQASYFLNILDSQSLPFANVGVVDFAPKKSLCWIDPAREGADYTAIVCGGRYLNDFIAVGFCFRRPWDCCIDELREMKEAFNVERFVLETNGLGEFPVRELQKSGCPCVGFNTTQNKHSKIMNAATLRDDIRLARIPNLKPEYLEAQKIFIEQTKNYEYNVEHDDAPDALASLISYIRG